jgi:hypothetical protein
MKLISVVCSLFIAVSSVFAQDPKEEPKAAARPAAPMVQRFQIVPTGNGTFLLDTFTGDSWVQINTVWVTTPKTTLPPEIYTALLNQAFRVVQGGAAAPATPTKEEEPKK